MKQIDFNTYVRNKLNLEVGFSDTQNSSEKTGNMNVIHNRLSTRQMDKQTNNPVVGQNKQTRGAQIKLTSPSCSSSKRAGGNKIIHLNKFK